LSKDTSCEQTPGKT